MKKLSIGVRLTGWYLLIFAAAQILFGVGMWLLLRYHLYDIADDDLESQIQDLKQFLEAQPPDASVASLQQAMNDFYSHEHAGDYLQVYAGNGQWLYRSAFSRDHAIAAPDPASLKKGFNRDHVYDGLPLRFTTQPVTVHGHEYTLQTAFLIDDVVGTLDAFRASLLMFAPIVFLSAAAGGFWLSRRALAPVDAIVRSAREISGTNLQARLETLHTGDELQRLSDTLNEMLHRIEDSFVRITRFTADASHELRTPISLVRTEAELALRKSRGQDEYREALQHILLETERATALIENLLALARADAGREALNMHALDLAPMLHGLANRWSAIADLRNLDFRTNLAAEGLIVLGDESALVRVVNILLDNAFKFTSAAGVVELGLTRRDEDAIVSVRDTGLGIAKEEQLKIFERFYQVDKARSRQSSGAGLGLAIAEWIVKQHNGKITVESEAGHGATFYVILPVRPSTGKDSATAYVRNTAE